MSVEATQPPFSKPAVRWYQYRLRTLLVLFPIVAIVVGLLCDDETIREEEYSRGGDHVISTPRFDIVVRGAGAVANGGGTIPVGGLLQSQEGEQHSSDGLELYYKYSWGTLSYRINNATFSLRNHARELWRTDSPM